MLPPIWQEPSAPRLRGNNRSARSAAFWISFSTTPASTVMVSLTVSVARMRLRREVETITSLMSACGWLPPVSPVLPPWGTIPTPASAQMRTTLATSAVDCGLNTRGTRPSQPSRKLLQ